jgi:hypothetical protein
MTRALRRPIHRSGHPPDLRAGRRSRHRRLYRLRHRVALRSSWKGQAATDYLLVLAFVALAMSLGAQGPVNDLVAAVAEHYRRFTWAISQP